ncbi:hypothetical protein GGF46_005113 [Coemansia sp. RSA 552]|nr:hypothetical protein GGF46_005113 [Coemansia sp. RSA 552]
MRRVGALALAVAAVSAQAFNGEFPVNPGTYSVSDLVDVISQYYNSYATVLEIQLSEAEASYPGAYEILTSIYGTDDIPDEYDAAYVSKLAEKMIEVGPTTVVDPDANTDTLDSSGTSTEGESEDASSETSEETAEETSENTDTETQDSDEDVFTLTTDDEENTDEDADTSAAYRCSKPLSVLGSIVLTAALGAALGQF